MINWMRRRIERSRARCHGAARALRRPRRAGTRDDTGLEAETDTRAGFGAETQSSKRVRRGAEVLARA